MACLQLSSKWIKLPCPLQVVLHASGLALVLGVGVVLLNLWSLLAAFRDAMLWALLCSIALRDAKDFLVQQLDRQLQQPRCAVCLLQSEPASTISLSTMSMLARCRHQSRARPLLSGRSTFLVLQLCAACDHPAGGTAAAARSAKKLCQTSSSLMIVSPGFVLQVAACDDPLGGPAATAHSGGHCE